MTNVHFCSLFPRCAENEWTETLPHADMVGAVALDLLGLGLRAVVVEVGGRGLTVQTCLAVEEGATLLRRAAGLQIPGCRGLSVAWCGWGHVRDLLGVGVLAADLGDASVESLAGLGEGIVAAVEVLALLRCVVSLVRGGSGRGGQLTLSLFCSRSFLFGSLPYRRKSLASSGDIFYATLDLGCDALPEGQQCEQQESCAGAANDVR